MRQALAIGLVLLAAAILNVAVTWGIALFANDYQIPPDENKVGLFVWDVAGTSFQTLLYRRPGSTLLYGRQDRDKELYGIQTFPMLTVPHWAQGPRSAPYIPGGNESWIELARGWPLLSFSCGPYSEPLRHMRPTNLSGHVVAWGIVVNRGGPGSRAGPRILPLRPIWPGFLVNSMLYGAALGLLFVAPGAIRRAWRRRRGRCVRCAYDLRGGVRDACPECGHAIVHPH